MNTKKRDPKNLDLKVVTGVKYDNPMKSPLGCVFVVIGALAFLGGGLTGEPIPTLLGALIMVIPFGLHAGYGMGKGIHDDEVQARQNGSLYILPKGESVWTGDSARAFSLFQHLLGKQWGSVTELERHAIISLQVSKPFSSNRDHSSVVSKLRGLEPADDNIWLMDAKLTEDMKIIFDYLWECQDVLPADQRLLAQLNPWAPAQDRSESF